MALAMVLALTVAACRPAPQGDADDGGAALRAAGYARAPVVSTVTQNGPSGFVVTGQASPDGRVRFIYGPQRAMGVTADSKGRFRADLPSGPEGGLYDLLIEDKGHDSSDDSASRLIHAEGRLFIPPGQAAMATLLRSGAPSKRLFNENEAMAVVDYDGAGALAVSGRVAVRTRVNIVIDGEIRATALSDARGDYAATAQIAPPAPDATTLSLTVQTATDTRQRDIAISLPNRRAGDHITAVTDGWRVDWLLPGGGMQTTLVF